MLPVSQTDKLKINMLELLKILFPKNNIVNRRLFKIYNRSLNYEKAISVYQHLSQDRQEKFKNSYNYLLRLGQTEQQVIRFYNFTNTYPINTYRLAGVFQAETDWILDFLEHHQLNDFRLDFFSIWGPKSISKINNGVPKIFYSPENHLDYIVEYRDYCIDDMDLTLGYEYLDNPKHLRFPYWLLHFCPPKITYEDLKLIIEQLNKPEHRILNRTKFASLIAGHNKLLSKEIGYDIGECDREQMFHLFNQISHVECAGKLLKNTTDLQEKFNNDKLAYLKQFKFNLCPENSSRHGYVTEKLINSIQAGCIPVYWGDDNPEPEILNHEAIIFYDPNNSQIALDRVTQLWQNRKLYEEFCHIPPFKPDAVDRIWEIVQELEQRIRVLIDRYGRVK